MKDNGFWSKVSPNFVTAIRIVLVTIMDCLLVYGGLICYSICIPLYTIIAVSDKLDGVLARRYGKETLFGEMFDRVADKYFIGSLVVIFSIKLYYIFPGWPVYASGAIITLYYEGRLFYNALRGYWDYTKNGISQLKVAAGRAGKAKMGIQIGVTAATLLGFFFLEIHTQATQYIGNSWLIAATATMYIGILYARKSLMFHRG